jgi:hypothetical protein
VKAESVHTSKSYTLDDPAEAQEFFHSRGWTDERSVLQHCAARLAKFKLPIRIQAMSAFPVTVSANATKIQKSRLRRIAEEMMRSA